MIGFVQGVVLFSDGNESIIQTNSGVGYQVYYSKILTEASRAFLFISHIVKENAVELYGFESLRTKKLFEMLITVKNIGPKSAFGLLRSLSTNEICDAIALENKKVLTSAPGVGPKGAAQMILDLSSKIHKVKMYSDRPVSLRNQSGIDEVVIEQTQVEVTIPASANQPQLLNDALMACKELGFKEEKVTPVAQKILKEHQITRAEQLVHLVLKEM